MLMYRSCRFLVSTVVVLHNMLYILRNLFHPLIGSSYLGVPLLCILLIKHVVHCTVVCKEYEAQHRRLEELDILTPKQGVKRDQYSGGTVPRQSSLVLEPCPGGAALANKDSELATIHNSHGKQVRELDGSEKAPELLQELFLEGTKQLIECLPGVWDNTVE